jgi:hypothetical protein
VFVLLMRWADRAYVFGEMGSSRDGDHPRRGANTSEQHGCRASTVFAPVRELSGRTVKIPLNTGDFGPLQRICNGHAELMPGL